MAKVVVYTGPFESVAVVTEHGELEAVRGEEVEVPDELADRLCEQDCWAQPDTATSPRTRKGDK